MNLRPAIYCTIVSAFVLSAHVCSANADPRVVTTDGITLSIKRASPSDRRIVLQFEVKNNTNARIYIQDDILSQKAFLGSGDQLQSGQIAGVEFCQFDCGKNPGASSLEKFSYVDPDGSLAFSLNYATNTPARNTDTISFTALFVTRHAKENGDPLSVGPVRTDRFNFTYIPLSD